MTLAEARPPESTIALLLRPVPESRPAAQRFGGARGSVGVSADQPSLLDALADMLDDPNTAPRPGRVVIRRDHGPGSVRPAVGLPEPGAWAAVLGLAVGQALVGVRPLTQLERWLDVAVLADLRHAARRRLREQPRAPRALPPVSVVSVRTQCPTPTTVEATIHVRVGRASLALGARLEASGQRWLCTALAQPPPVTELRTARDTA